MWEGKYKALDEDWAAKYAAMMAERDEYKKAWELAAQELAKLKNFVAYGAANRILNLAKSKAWEKGQYESNPNPNPNPNPKAWEKWQYEYAEYKRQLKMMKGAALRIRNRMLSRAFEKWQSEANKMTKTEYLLNRALMKMLHRQLAMGWQKWWDDYQDHKRMLKVFKGAAARWRKLKISKAWNQWRWVAAKYASFLNGMTKQEILDRLEVCLFNLNSAPPPLALSFRLPTQNP